jgi:hypothetical protein
VVARPAPRPAAVPAVPPGFDGAWLLIQSCPALPDRSGFNRTISIQVAGGSFHGQDGVNGRPNWLTVSGTITPDGTVTADASGLTGPPTSSGDPPPGRVYNFSIVGKVAGANGSGKRLGGRDCDITFVRPGR